jgi:hypothetical protein
VALCPNAEGGALMWIKQQRVSPPTCKGTEMSQRLPCGKPRLPAAAIRASHRALASILPRRHAAPCRSSMVERRSHCKADVERVQCSMTKRLTVSFVVMRPCLFSNKSK